MTFLKPHARKAWVELVEAVNEYGSNCSESDTPERWTGWTDDKGREQLPDAEEAETLCGGCPVFDKCDIWRRKGGTTFGVLAGKTIDTWREVGKVADEIGLAPDDE